MSHKEELRKMFQALYDAAYQINEETTEDDYDQYPELLDEAANITSILKHSDMVEDGIVHLPEE